MLWHGRAWLKKSKTYDDIGRIEWMFGKHARGISANVTFGSGENERGIMFHACIPFIASIYLTLEFKWIKAKERRLGFAIHNNAFWLYIFDAVFGDGGSAEKCWYQRYYHWDFPWQYDWYSTEVLNHADNDKHIKTLFIERRGDRRKDRFAAMRESEPIKLAASKIYDYTYTLKSGKIQNRKATVFVDRMTWRMRWYPILPFVKVTTGINVTFNEEVGERAGSYKGGCVGCGYTMLPNESPLQTLRRMEAERKFGR